MLKIKAAGIGGAGENIVARLAAMELPDVECLVMNTDIWSRPAGRLPKVQLGEKLAKGCSPGGSVEIGRGCAEESREAIAEALRGARLLFLLLGLGGGTGTGAAPVVARIAREMGLMTACLAAGPLPFEGAKRRLEAELGFEALREATDALLLVPIERFAITMSKTATFGQILEAADDLICRTVRRAADLARVAETIDADFADLLRKELASCPIP